jgi:hypothetical protein
MEARKVIIAKGCDDKAKNLRLLWVFVGIGGGTQSTTIMPDFAEVTPPTTNKHRTGKMTRMDTETEVEEIKKWRRGWRFWRSTRTTTDEHLAAIRATLQTLATKDDLGALRRDVMEKLDRVEHAVLHGPTSPWEPSS